VNVAQDPGAFRAFEFEGWQGAADRYHESWSVVTRQTAGTMLDRLHVTDGCRFLDVASGPGYLAARAAERGATCTAVDFSPAMIEKGQSIYPGITFRPGDAQDLPFAAGSFDAVGMNFGMLHLGDPEAAMREAHRVLAGGGRFAFTVWASPTEALGFALILKAVADHGEPVAIPHGPDFFLYSRPDECRAALAAAGFSAIDVTKLDLTWHPESAEDVFPAYLQGTARMGGLLRGQGPEARARIQAAVTDAAQAYADANGKITIPMPAVLAVGTKP
jgi:SAM-dependent methyltransferase